MSFRNNSRGSRPNQSGNNRFRGGGGGGGYRGGGGGFRGGRGKARPSFDPSMLINKAVAPSEAMIFSPKNTFEDFNFHPQLLKAIQDKGYTSPTAIQDQAIQPLLEGRDLLGVARTGTGKTAAFLLPLIHNTYKQDNKRVLVMAPTRELAVQIRDELDSFTHQMQMNSALCIGGVPINRQISGIRRKPDFVIGTPGRLIDLHKRGILSYNDFTTIVLDEVDQMLDMGFIHDIRYVVERLPEQRQSLFFSATIPKKMDSIVSSFLKNPVHIEIKRETTTDNITQDIIRIKGQSKIDILHELLTRSEFEKVLVFGRTKHSLNKLAQILEDRGIRVAAIHGNKSQQQRQRALTAFKKNNVDVLLATDIASRGLDIDNVSHVINFDLPESYEDYIHRIGRTGRADKTGIALSFVE
ncbi:MAG: DEAD/DEAH box helicase [Microgenomates group bacterium]